MATALTPIRIALREIRLEAELTQVDLAEAAGVRNATISDLESEKRARSGRRLVDLDVIEKICRVLSERLHRQVDPGDIFELSPIAAPPKPKRRR